MDIMSSEYDENINEIFGFEPFSEGHTAFYEGGDEKKNDENNNIFDSCDKLLEKIKENNIIKYEMNSIIILKGSNKNNKDTIYKQFEKYNDIIFYNYLSYNKIIIYHDENDNIIHEFINSYNNFELLKKMIKKIKKIFKISHLNFMMYLLSNCIKINKPKIKVKCGINTLHLLLKIDEIILDILSMVKDNKCLIKFDTYINLIALFICSDYLNHFHNCLVYDE